MSLNIGDRVKSYDFILGDMLLNDKAYVVGDIVDIAPVDWCSENCDHYHIKILERFDAHGEPIEVIGDMVYPPVFDSMVVLSTWPNDELNAELFYDYVTGKNRSCVWCGGTPKFMVYDLPTGPHAFCSEKHYARYAGLDEKPPGWYGFDAQEYGTHCNTCGGFLKDCIGYVDGEPCNQAGSRPRLCTKCEDDIRCSTCRKLYFHYEGSDPHCDVCDQLIGYDPVSNLSYSHKRWCKWDAGYGQTAGTCQTCWSEPWLWSNDFGYLFFDEDSSHYDSDLNMMCLHCMEEDEPEAYEELINQLPEKEPKKKWWKVWETQTASESHDCGVCGTAVTILNDDYGTCPKCNTFWNLVRLQDLWDGADDDIKVLDAEQTVMLESVKPGTTTESHLWIVRFTTSDDRIIEIPIDPSGGLNREEVIVKAAKVLDRKLSQECDACQVSAWDEVLIQDRRPAYLDEEGDGCSIGKVISCQPCMQLNDEDWIATAFQPKEAESVQKFYMVHRHDAKRAGLHYDLRLEDNGVLKSWAIPKGMPKSGKHLAIQTPDHALSYGKWEGTIKSGYGAGDVKIDTSGTYKTLSKDSKKWKFEILSGKYKGVWTLTKWKDDKWLIIRNKTLGSENWGGDPEGPLAKALAKARQESKKPKKPLKIEKLSAESNNQMFRREAILFGIGIASAVVGTFLAEMLIDRYREDPELLDTPIPEQNA